MLTFKGQPISIQGSLPPMGTAAPGFTLLDNTLKSRSLSEFKGKKVVLNIFPSIDTPVCALQLHTFNQQVAGRDDIALLFVSLDLPFANQRFCAAENISNAITLSDFKDKQIATQYGLTMESGPLAGLYARAVFVLDEELNIIHTDLVSEVTHEPDYNAVLELLK